MVLIAIELSCFESVIQQSCMFWPKKSVVVFFRLSLVKK